MKRRDFFKALAGGVVLAATAVLPKAPPPPVRKMSVAGWAEGDDGWTHISVVSDPEETRVYLDGKISRVKCWNEPLTKAQVREEYAMECRYLEASK